MRKITFKRQFIKSIIATKRKQRERIRKKKIIEFMKNEKTEGVAATGKN